MLSHNLSDENRGQVTPNCYHKHFQSVGHVSDNRSIRELGLQSGEQLARYYLALVRILSSQEDVTSSTKACNLKQLRVNRERLEIEEYTKNFQKQR
jgi:hypothetical protein